MSSSGQESWMLDAIASWWFVAVWVVIVLLYGMYRSLGDARQDPHRPSGPFPPCDEPFPSGPPPFPSPRFR